MASFSPPPASSTCPPIFSPTTTFLTNFFFLRRLSRLEGQYVVSTRLFTHLLTAYPLQGHAKSDDWSPDFFGPHSCCRYPTRRSRRYAPGPSSHLSSDAPGGSRIRHECLRYSHRTRSSV